MNDKNKSELLVRVEELEAKLKATEDKLLYVVKAMDALANLKTWVDEQLLVAGNAAREHALRAICGDDQEKVDSPPQARAFNTRAGVFREIKDRIAVLESARHA